MFASDVGSNIVGFGTTEVDASGYFMSIGVNFSNLKSDDGSYNLADKFFDHVGEEGDQAFVWDPDMWDIITYDKLPEGEGWSITYPGGIPGAAEAINVPKGGLIWYIPVTADGGVTISGEVAPVGKRSVTFDLDNPEGQYMFPLANPLPIDTTWGDLTSFTHEGDQMFTWDADMWDINTYDRLASGEGWQVTFPGGVSEMIPEDEGTLATVFLKIGESALYIPSQTTTWTVEIAE